MSSLTPTLKTWPKPYCKRCDLFSDTGKPTGHQKSHLERFFFINVFKKTGGLWGLPPWKRQFWVLSGNNLCCFEREQQGCKPRENRGFRGSPPLKNIERFRSWMATIYAILSLNNRGVYLEKTGGLGGLPPWQKLKSWCWMATIYAILSLKNMGVCIPRENRGVGGLTPLEKIESFRSWMAII